MELQQRACEYHEMLESSWDASRVGILDRMPVSNEAAASTILQRPIGDVTIDEVPPLTNGVNKSSPQRNGEKSTTGSNW